MRPRITALLFGAVLLAACGSNSQASDRGEPLPTIGLGSDVGDGRITGGVDVRAVGGEDVEQIVVIGDSITEASVDPLLTRLSDLGFDDPVINAKTGKRMSISFGSNDSGRAIASFISGDDTYDDALWIVALGTNDIDQYPTEDDVAGAVEAVIDEVPDEAPLIWVDTYWTERPEGTEEVNDAIERVVADRGNAAVAHWTEVAGIDGVLRRDGVHPSSGGTEFFAAVVAETVQDFLQI
jgi:lysophospholipase L1-like esterase